MQAVFEDIIPIRIKKELAVLACIGRSYRFAFCDKKGIGRKSCVTSVTQFLAKPTPRNNLMVQKSNCLLQRADFNCNANWL